MTLHISDNYKKCLKKVQEKQDHYNYQPQTMAKTQQECGTINFVSGIVGFCLGLMVCYAFLKILAMYILKAKPAKKYTKSPNEIDYTDNTRVVKCFIGSKKDLEKKRFIYTFNGKMYTTRVIDVKQYSSALDYVKGVGYTMVCPWAKDDYSATGPVHKFYTDKEIDEAGGICSFNLETPNKIIM